MTMIKLDRSFLFSGWMDGRNFACLPLCLLYSGRAASHGNLFFFKFSPMPLHGSSESFPGNKKKVASWLKIFTVLVESDDCHLPIQRSCSH